MNNVSYSVSLCDINCNGQQMTNVKHNNLKAQVSGKRKANKFW